MGALGFRHRQGAAPGACLPDSGLGRSSQALHGQRLLTSSGARRLREALSAPLLAGRADTQVLGPCLQDPWFLTSLVQEGVRGAGTTIALFIMTGAVSGWRRL